MVYLPLPDIYVTGAGLQPPNQIIRGVPVGAADERQQEALSEWVLVLNAAAEEAAAAEAVGAEAAADDHHVTMLQRIQRHGGGALRGIGMVPADSTVAHIFFHVNVACPGAVIVLLLNGPVEDSAWEVAGRHHPPRGKLIFNDRLVQGFWAVTEEDANGAHAYPGRPSFSKFRWWFHHSNQVGSERLVEFHHSLQYSTEFVRVFATTAVDPGRGHPKQLCAKLL